MSYRVPNCNGYSFQAQEPTSWPVFDGDGQYLGHIFEKQAWAVPSAAHEALQWPNHLPLYYSDAGGWAKSLSAAEERAIALSKLGF